MDLTDFESNNWAITPLGSMDGWSESLRSWSDFLLRSAQPALLIWGEERSLLFNSAYSEILGPRYLSALGKPLQDVLSPLWDQISGYVDEAFSGKSGTVDDTEFATWQSGYTETKFFSFAYTPIFCPLDAERPIGTFCALSDRTETVQRNSELKQEFERLHEIYEHAPGFIAMADGPEHRFTFANAAYRELVGRSDIVGRTVAEVLPEIVRQGFIDILDGVFETGVPFVGRALPITLEDAETGTFRKRFIDTIYHPVRSAAGEIIGLFAEGHDVTQQVEAQNLATALQGELLRVSRATAMESFGAAVAHEINQPLAAAVNYLGVASKLIGQPDQEDRLAKMIESASAATLRSGDILRRLRNLSSLKGESERTELVKIVIEAIAVARMANDGLSITTGGMESCYVDVDPVQIQQVLLNLIKNAQDAMVGHDDSPIEISVRCRAAVAEVSVKDRGGGVSDEMMGRLFDWFATTKADGSGIGLSISKQIIDAHEGKIWVTNEADGAVFRFSLPLLNGTES